MVGNSISNFWPSKRKWNFVLFQQVPIYFSYALWVDRVNMDVGWYFCFYLSIYIFFYIFIYLSIYLPIYLSTYLSIYLSIHIYIYIYKDIYIYRSELLGKCRHREKFLLSKWWTSQNYVIQYLSVHYYVFFFFFF